MSSDSLTHVECRRLLLQLILPITAALPLTGHGELLFKDDFATGDLSSYNDHFRWGRSGAAPAAGFGKQYILEVSGPTGSPVKALMFRYAALADQKASSDDKHWAEQRFHLTSSKAEKRTESGSSSVAHGEIWFGYSLRIPDNYFHRRAYKADGSARPNNNKGWITLWKNKYSQPSGSAFGIGFRAMNEGQVNPSSNWFDPAVSDGDSYITLGLLKGTTRWDSRPAPSYVAPALKMKESKVRAVGTDEAGKWIDYVFGIRVSSATSSAGPHNGFLKIYKDGELAAEFTGLDNWYNGPSENNGFDRGYLMGYHNSGYAQETIYYLTNFRVGTTKADVIDLANKASPPAPPILQLQPNEVR